MIHVKSIFKSSKKAIDVKIGSAQKIKFSIKDFFSKCDQNPQFPVDLVTFTEKNP